MSIFSDYKCGALSEEEFRMEGNAMNIRDRIEQREMFEVDPVCAEGCLYGWGSEECDDCEWKS